MDTMHEQPRSPLTNSIHVELIETLIVKELIEDWKVFFSIDISEENISKYEKIDLFRCQETDLLFYYPFDIAGSEKLYNSLSRFDWYYMTEKWEHNIAINSLRDSFKILDIGCGYGAFVYRLRQSGKTEVIGIEQNKNALEFTRRENLPVFDLTLDQIAENHKEYFDAVSIFQVLEHIIDPLQFLKDIVALIKPGGKLIISVPNSESFAKYATKHLLDQPPHHMHRWSKQTFLSLEEVLPIKLTKMKFEPLARYHVDWFLDIQHSRLPNKKLIRKVASFVFDNVFSSVLKKSILIRKLIRGHTLYVEFLKKL